MGTFEAERLALQQVPACFSRSITLRNQTAPDGSSTALVLLLPPNYEGGPVTLGPGNAYLQRTGGGRTDPEIAFGVASGELRIDAAYGVGATVQGSLVISPSGACGSATGEFCPEGQRCAAILFARADAGVCVDGPPSVTCENAAACRLGENCLAGRCETLCSAQSPCASDQVCTAFADSTFITRRLGYCRPKAQVAAARGACPEGVGCALGSECVSVAGERVCADYCQSNLACGDLAKVGCVPFGSGNQVCVVDAGEAGDPCDRGCRLGTVCISADGICHETCGDESDCPATRPSCKALTIGDRACSGP